jgi:hypothetical protein
VRGRGPAGEYVGEVISAKSPEGGRRMKDEKYSQLCGLAWSITHMVNSVNKQAVSSLSYLYAKVMSMHGAGGKASIKCRFHLVAITVFTSEVILKVSLRDNEGPKGRMSTRGPIPIVYRMMVRLIFSLVPRGEAEA